jgi:DNA-3-methyladenine glycosylase II
MAIGRSRGSPLTSSVVTPQNLQSAIDHLVACEPRFTAIVDRHGLPSLRLVDNSLPSLLRIVVEQLISLKAAEAIWTRLHVNVEGLAPQSIIAAGVHGIRAHGTTMAKARCFVALAEAAHEGRLDFAELARLPDDEARTKLVALPGIGPWTADIYLLAALGRADACPAGDLALQVAAQDLFGLGERPNAKAFLAHATAWRPWRGVAARLLWSHYRGLKGMAQA